MAVPEASPTAWAALFISGGTFVILLWDRVAGKGKSVANLDNSIKGLCDRIDDMEGRLAVVDGLANTVKELVYEWRGVDGEDGYKRIIREDHQRIDAIEQRDAIIEAVKRARAEDEQRSGGLHRRKSERDINNLLPEERQEKG